MIGYHASHEQFTPSDLLRFVRQAEQAGFEAAMCSDHFYPWTEAQGQSGFAWSWLGAALQATSLSLGVVCAPWRRYHPAVIAQASATLAEMFPGRSWLALGSGEALNEHIIGLPWPPKKQRNQALRDSAEVIRALWRGETVNHEGMFTLRNGRLFTLPPSPPLLVGAAVSPATARWVAGWADALATVWRPHEELRRVIEAFRAGGGEGKPMFLQVHLSYAAGDELARQNAYDQWRANVLDSELLAELATPEQFEAAAAFVRRDDLDAAIRISSDLDRHAEWLAGDLELGFERVYLHNVGRNQAEFIEAFGTRVLPAVRRSVRAAVSPPDAAGRTLLD